MPNSVQIVQLGYDTDVFDENAAQDSRSRQVGYTRYLQERCTGARVINIVLTPDRGLKKQEVGVLTLDPVNYYRRRHIVSLFVYLRQLHKQAPISLLTTQDIAGIFWAALAFGLAYRVPVVGQVHYDLVAEYGGRQCVKSVFGRLYKRMVLGCLRFYDGLRVVNSETGAFLRERGYKKPVCVCPVPVALLPSSKTKTASASGAPLRVLFVGRFVLVKNLDCWLKTAHRALQSGEDMEFVLVGDGEERRHLETLCSELGIAERVHFIGALPPEQLADWYAASDVLLLTSRQEGFGRVIVEAMYHYVVPVCSNVAGAREIIQPGINGYLGEATPEVLAEHLIDLSRDSDKRHRMGVHARKQVEHRFMPERLRRMWLDFLLSFVSPRIASHG